MCGVCEDGRYVGAPADLSELWRDPLLRLFAEPARQQTRKHFRPPGSVLVRAGRTMVVLFCGSDDGELLKRRFPRPH
jgi:hypothetical protein